MAWRFLVLTLGFGLALSAGCFTNFNKVDDAAGGAGATTGIGGMAGGAGGVGGAPPCTNPMPGECTATTVREPFGLAQGTVTVTDVMVRPVVQAADNIFLAGHFTGTVDIVGGGQVTADNEGDGFILELTSAGAYVDHTIIEEADANTVLMLDQSPATGDFIVAGFAAQSGGACTSRGLFMRRLDNVFMDRFPPVCIPADMATTLTLNDTAHSDADYVALAGSFSGVFSAQSSVGVDGYVVTIDPMGTLEEAYIVGGTGDAAVRAIEDNPVTPNTWLIAGDFSGQLELTVPVLGSQTRNAAGARDLFVATYDAFDGDPNLAVVSMGAPGGDHRLVDMNLYGDGEAVLLAELVGPLAVATVDVPAPTPSGALAMVFDVPSAVQGMQSFAVEDYYLMRGDAVSVQALQTRSQRIAIAAQATGDLLIDKGSRSGWGRVPSCTQDAMVIDLNRGNDSYTGNRCGDPAVRPTAIGSGDSDAYVAAFEVPAGQQVTVDASEIAGPTVALLIVSP